MQRATECRGTERGGEGDRGQELAQPEAAHPAVVGGQPAVLDHGVAEGVRRDHLDDQARRVGRLLETREDAAPGGLVGAEGEDVVVVERDPPRADLGQLVAVLPGVEGGAAGGSEGVDPDPADRPQAERERVLRGGLAGYDGLLELFVV